MPKSFLHTVEHKGFGQNNMARCWYASYRMMLKYLNRNPDEVKDKLKAVLNFDDAYENGLFVSDYRKAADALGMDILDSTPFRKEQTFFDVGLSDGAEAFLKVLENKPVWVSRFSSVGVYHITVAVGYDDKESDIIFNNPFPGPNDAWQSDKLKANIYVRHITRQIGSVQMPK